jgi:hypothetical protein
MAHWIVTANRLLDGGVVYRTAERGWSEALEDAAVGDEAVAEAELQRARGDEHVICDPYRIDVGLEGGRPVPLSVRERIRAEGPLPTLRRLGYDFSQRDRGEHRAEPRARAVG